MSGGGPGDTWRNLQKHLQNAQQRGRFGGSPGGSPRGIGGAVALLALGGGAVVLSNSLFNGMVFFRDEI